MQRRMQILTAVLFSAAPMLAAQADNGELAYAIPATDITADGVLSDWPAYAPRFPIQREGSGDVRAADGSFDAHFRAAYDTAANALFIGLEIIDDQHRVAENEDADWSRQDGVILYLDERHEARGSGPVLYSATGQQRRLLSDENSWDPAVRTADWDNVSLAVKRTDDRRTVYEWRIDMSRPLLTGTSLGLDFLVSDDDTPGEDDPAQLYSWGAGFGKSQAGGRLGDLLLIDGRVPLGTLEGDIDWQPLPSGSAAEGERPHPTRVRVASDLAPASPLHVSVDASGHYEALLPPGDYRVSIPDRTVGDAWGDLQVIGDGATQAATVSAARRTIAQTLPVKAIAPPDLLQEQGVLFAFDPSEDTAQVDTAIEALLDYYDVPGASVALVKDGTLAYHRVFGTSNAYTGAPTTDDTLFEAASITKIVFAFAVNRLAERGEIDLDRPLHEYLPFEEIAHDPRYRKITARHVLSHQTGFPNWRWATDDGRMHINFYPGTRYGYSGEGFEYLGRVVSHIAGKPLADIVRDEVQIPMGFAARTVFSGNDQLADIASRGHLRGMAGPHDFPGEIGVAHSMYTEAREFANFMVNLMARKGLSADSYARMWEPQIGVPAEPGDAVDWPAQYGLGFHLMESPYGRVYGHGGNNGNFVCMFEAYDEHNMGFIVFTNADTGAQVVNALRRYLIVGREGDGSSNATAAATR